MSVLLCQLMFTNEMVDECIGDFAPFQNRSWRHELLSVLIVSLLDSHLLPSRHSNLDYLRECLSRSAIS
jgi:hypothetical protein